MIDQPAQPSFRPVAVRYGLILGGISIGMALLGYLTNSDPSMPDTNSTVRILYQVIGFGVMIWAIVMAIKTHRDNDLGGNISFGRAVLVALVTAAIAGALGGLFTLLYTTVINPSYLDTIRDVTQAKMEEQNMSEEQIEMASKISGSMTSPAMLFVFSILGNALFGTIIGLVAGAVMKREPKQF